METERGPGTLDGDKYHISQNSVNIINYTERYLPRFQLKRPYFLIHFVILYSYEPFLIFTFVMVTLYISHAVCVYRVHGPEPRTSIINLNKRFTNTLLWL